MIKQSLLMSTLVAALLLSTASVFAADTVYGSEMMTEQERNEHRTQIRNATTEEERSKIRNEHHKRMKERAQKRGLSIPDEPPVKAKKLGNGQGMGQGMGFGQGMGSGGGRNR